MWVELIAAGFLVGTEIYRRLTDEDDQKEPRKEQKPHAEAGVPIPLIIGKVRVRKPILAWMGPRAYETRGDYGEDARQNLFFVLGAGFFHGSGPPAPTARNRIHKVWIGDSKAQVNGGALEDLIGNGNFEATRQLVLAYSDTQIVGDIEFLNGHPNQTLANSGATNRAGDRMMAAPPHGTSTPEAEIPGYRGCLSVCLFQLAVAGGFNFGRQTSLPAINLEASSFNRDTGEYPAPGIYSIIGGDANPANALYELLTSPYALGIDQSRIDFPSFQYAGGLLYSEGHGVSAYIPDAREARQWIEDLLRQIDGDLYYDPRTDKIYLKLIRNDFDPQTVFTLDKGNCSKIVGVAIGSWEDLPNRIEVNFENRDLEYAEDVAPAGAPPSNDARTVSLTYPFCKTSSLAKRLAERELAARDRPIVKLRAYCGRETLALRPGDPVKLVHKNPDIDGVIFRVANAEYGTLENGMVALDLISDAHRVWGNHVPPPLPGVNLDIDNPVVMGG